MTGLGLFRLLRADLLKTKRTSLLLIHLLVPAVGAGLFLAYYSFSPWNPIEKASGYLQVLAIAFPTLIGLVCSMAAEQESATGNFQGMLTASTAKILAFISKLFLLLLFGFGAIFFASGAFGWGFSEILHQDTLGIRFYLIGASILFGSNLFLYVLHLFVSLRFGKGASIGLGIVESLLSALLLTGLGDGIWPFIPCGWGVRFVSLWTTHASGSRIMPAFVSELRTGTWICIFAALLAFILACVWFWRWEGRKSEE